MKARLTVFLLVWMLAAFPSACTRDSSDEQALRVIRFESAKEQPFELEDLLTDVRIVPLETANEALFGADLFSRILVGEKHIIVFGQEKVLQFAGDGSFERVLSLSGKGPEEFQFITAFTLDEPEGRLLYYDIRNKMEIEVRDLSSGAFLDPVPIPLNSIGADAGVRISQLEMTGKDSLFGLAEVQLADHQIVYVQNLKGEYLGGVLKKDSTERVRDPFGNHLLPLTMVGEGVAFYNANRDTLFTFSGKNKEIYATLSYQDKLLYSSSTPKVSGNTMLFIGEGVETLLFVSLLANLERFESGYVIGKAESFGPMYRLSKSDFSISVSPVVEMDHLNIPLKHFRNAKGFVYAAFNADEFKPMLQQAIENSSDDPEALSRWQTLDTQITENDNPILIIGKMK